jgi:transcriptional regulator with XRE-family HTH domain
MQATSDLTSDNIGDALLAKRKQRRLDQGRAAAEIGVSPSTYRSYEKNTQRPSVNVFPLLAKFLGLDIEEFLPLYAATVIYALRPALEKELALQNGQSAGEASHYSSPDTVDEDSEFNEDDEDQDDTVDSSRENFSYQRDEETAPSSPREAVAQAFEEQPVSENTISEDEDDEDEDEDEDEDDEDEDEEKEDFESSDLSSEGEIVTRSPASQFTSIPSNFERSAKPKKKKKKKKR